MAEPGFWDNKDKAQADVERVSRLRGIIEPFRGLETRIGDLGVLRELAEEEPVGEPRTQAENEVVKECRELERALDAFEIQCLLGGEFDRNDAYMTIHSGAGGTEACDWADMLMRMYQRWIERHGLKSEILDIQPGDETGVKWVTLRVIGEHAYGYLQTERGVHRLGAARGRRAREKRRRVLFRLEQRHVRRVGVHDQVLRERHVHAVGHDTQQEVVDEGRAWRSSASMRTLYTGVV
jgi:protein subunit release factor A